MSLNGTLVVSLNYPPTPGDNYQIIKQQSNAPVNGTFAGLAEGGVVLSGTGSDGTLGLEAIKAAGAPTAARTGLFRDQRALLSDSGAAPPEAPGLLNAARPGRTYLPREATSSPRDASSSEA